MNAENKIVILTQGKNLFELENATWQLQLFNFLSTKLQAQTFGGIPHLGAGIVASEVESAGFKVDILDSTQPRNVSKAESYDRIFWSVIDVSLTRCTQWLQQNPDLQNKVVVGGQGITANNIQELAQQFPQATFVLGRSEGLIKPILANWDDPNRKHLHIQSEFSLSDAHNEPYMAPEHDFRKKGSFKKSMIKPVESTTGCTQKCDFCSISKEAVTHKPPNTVIQEIKQMHLKRGDLLLFVDHNLFNNKPENLEKIFNWINQHHISWSGEGTITQIIQNKQLLALMAKNCSSFLVGLEDIPTSDPPANFGSYLKDKLHTDFPQTLEAVRQAKFPVTWSLVFPLEHHTSQTFIQAAKFIQENKLDVNLHLLCPRNGSQLFDQIELEERWREKGSGYRDGLHLVFKPKNMAWEEAMAGFIWLQTKINSVSWLKERFVSNCKELSIKKAVFLLGIELLADKLRSLMMQTMYPQLKPEIAKYEKEWNNLKN